MRPTLTKALLASAALWAGVAAIGRAHAQAAAQQAVVGSAPATPAVRPTPTLPPVEVATPAPAVQLEPAGPSIAARLQRIAVSRVMVFGDAAQLPARIESLQQAREFMDRWQSGSVFEFVLTPSSGWSILRVDAARLLEAAAPGVSLLADARGSEAISAAAQPYDIDLGAQRTVVRLRAAAPPRTLERLTRLAARFDVLVGRPRVARIERFVQSVGRRLAERELGRDVAVVLDGIEGTVVKLTVRGRTEMVGELEFLDPDGGPILPVAIDSLAPDPALPPEARTAEYRFIFPALPPEATLLIHWFDALQTVAVPVALDQLGLP